METDGIAKLGAIMEPGSITRLLHDLAQRVDGAEDRLFARVYDELRRMAAARVREGGRNAPDSPEELVHEAYARLADHDFESRRHLFFAYTRAMRQILVERARRKQLPNMDGEAATVDVAKGSPNDELATCRSEIDVVEVAALVERLKNVAPREADVVMLRFFGGLREADIAEILRVDERTVRRDWASARERFRAWTAQ